MAANERSTALGSFDQELPIWIEKGSGKISSSPASIPLMIFSAAMAALVLSKLKSRAISVSMGPGKTVWTLISLGFQFSPQGL